MDKFRFYEIRNDIVGVDRAREGIGTLAEKTQHAILKRYFEPDEDNHEVKVGSYFADIVGENGIIEIQTRGFGRLRKKLTEFLAVTAVTVVYPVAQTKWVCWIDGETGEVTKRRKSPKTGTPQQIFSELCYIKGLLNHPNLRFCIVLLDAEEYRNLDGWSRDKKRGSTRQELIPTDLIDEIYINNVADYDKLIPGVITYDFTTKDYAKAAKISLSLAQTALNVLYSVGAVERVGKQGRLYLYRRTGQAIKYKN